ncbi:unnamed protein product [Orchesella dallaii]|uniref:NWD2 C-terminal beta-propeller domain-containing protein n=1 Tax=Orchesella dallaii TaxID=48710 RepID=A0ABP1Q653_9HEXA
MINRKEIMLVADALRLGGAILMNHPQMLGPQLVGRLLPEMGSYPNVKKLLEQCDTEGLDHCALMPASHCFHTPGGPLKYSLEGHQFAVFGYQLTADFRYIVSISNKFVTWDLSTSDMSREVIPNIEGILQGLVISPDNRYCAAFSNINQTILLNMLTNEFQIFENPLEDSENITGLSLLNTHLIVYGHHSWVLFNINGDIEEKTVHPHELKPILHMYFDSLQDYTIVLWSGSLDETRMQWLTHIDGEAATPLEFDGALAITADREKVFTLVEQHENCLVELTMSKSPLEWAVTRVYEGNNDKLIQLQFSQNEMYIVGTFMFGFKVWNLESGRMVTLLLPEGIRNISTKLLESNSCVLSKDAIYAIAGVRKNLYVWDMIKGELLKNLDAHFGRIIKIQSLTIGNWNSVITSSIDRTVKVWNINNIFEQVHVIDRHELQIDSISISPEAYIAATSTRNCVGVWDLRLGKLIGKLADSPLGAIVTHAVVTKSGRNIISAESGFLLIWNVHEGKVIFKETQDSIKQIFLIEKDTVVITVSKVGGAELRELAIARSVPSGEKIFEFEFPIKTLRDVIPTSDETLLVGPGFEKLKDTLYIFNSKTGLLMHKIVLKYPNFKDYTSLLPMPRRATQIALIDSDKGNILDVKSKKFIRSVPKWGGQCTRDGKFGLYAPGRGGLELLELKHGKSVRTFIPKVAEGVFTIMCMFNRTNEYVLYYHGGRKTIRVFRTADAKMIANYRVPAELSSIDSTSDGKSLVLGTVDGCVTVLVLADPAKPEIKDYMKELPSRNEEIARREAKRFTQIYFKTAAKLVALAHRVHNAGESRKDDVYKAETNQDASKDQQAHLEKSYTTDTESGITISSEHTLTEQRANGMK